jgi:hypothetical protein
MSAHTKVHAHTILLFGLGGLSTLLSFTARLKFSFLFSFSPSEGVAPPPSGPQVGSVHKPAQLIWAPCLPYWHGCLYWHDLSKTCQNVGTLQNVGAADILALFLENFRRPLEADCSAPITLIKEL